MTSENPTQPPADPPADPKPTRAPRTPKPGTIVRLDDPDDAGTAARLAVVVGVDSDGLDVVELPAARRHELQTYPVG